MLKYMVNDGAGALSGDLLAQGDDSGVKVRARHSPWYARTGRVVERGVKQALAICDAKLHFDGVGALATGATDCQPRGPPEAPPQTG